MASTSASVDRVKNIDIASREKRTRNIFGGIRGKILHGVSHPFANVLKNTIRKEKNISVFVTNPAIAKLEIDGTIHSTSAVVDIVSGHIME
jgi:hypothetical protein